ncbi:hypothetical protein GH714_032772 [Hevea brasiliensis]|uniref:Uncharacterized protein n=1 Tax=Hevea brasiliensis TaxID=3981 RepID=A0A6A6NDN2_HEVBR|nr:hypothetical protein GH714_032772 [Hevea brasiliensis]
MSLMEEASGERNGAGTEVSTSISPVISSLSPLQLSSYPIPLRKSTRKVSKPAWLQDIVATVQQPTVDFITSAAHQGWNHVQLKSTKLQKYLCAENGGGTSLVANRSIPSDWETFRLWRINDTYFNLRVLNKQFVGLETQGNKLVAVSNTAGDPETFHIIRNTNDPTRVRFQASNGQLLQAQSETLVTADYGGSVSGWEDSDPSVFIINIVRTLQGEYQITNGYGPDKAPKVLQDHWNTYIKSEDFNFLSSNNISAVRIPVGWWIAHDPTPPKPFVGGSLKALDNAFTWAEKYGIKVIVDLHAAQGSQNGNEHSAARDGFQEWGDSYIQDTVAVIDFLAARYANRPSLAAIALMNEPQAPGISLDTLTKYYQAAYEAVRKYTQTAYVILSNRLGPADPTELLSFASTLNLVAIDVHYYNLFWDGFTKMSVQQNIDFIYNSRSNDLRKVTTTNGPSVLLVTPKSYLYFNYIDEIDLCYNQQIPARNHWASFVVDCMMEFFAGEWTAEWNVKGASKEDYQKFAKAQQEVYGRATFGWAYWAYKCASRHWSLKWNIENNIIHP